jgi:hypothetical protein
MDIRTETKIQSGISCATGGLVRRTETAATDLASIMAIKLKGQIVSICTGVNSLSIELRSEVLETT